MRQCPPKARRRVKGCERSKRREHWQERPRLMKRVEQAPLSDGDVLMLGRVLLRFLEV